MLTLIQSHRNVRTTKKSGVESLIIIIIIRKQIQTVKTFSDDIHMDFGLEKRAKITFKKGKLIHS